MAEDIHFDILRNRYVGSTHQILIDPHKDKRLFDFLVSGRKDILKSGIEKPAQAVATYVHETLLNKNMDVEEIYQRNEETHQRRYQEGEIPFLGELFDAPICKDQNIVAHLLLAQCGYSSELVRGYVYVMQPHAWVEVPFTEEVVDAVLGLAINKDDYYSRFVNAAGTRLVLVRPHEMSAPSFKAQGLENKM